METGYAEIIVCEENTASFLGSGLLPVFATPALVALMEKAACEAMKGYLKEGETSVGIEITVKHTAATPVGMKVRAKAEVTEVKGRFYTFRITADDEKGEIGSGIHVRAVINTEKFMNKAKARKET